MEAEGEISGKRVRSRQGVREKGKQRMGLSQEKTSACQGVPLSWRELVKIGFSIYEMLPRPSGLLKGAFHILQGSYKVFHVPKFINVGNPKRLQGLSSISLMVREALYFLMELSDRCTWHAAGISDTSTPMSSLIVQVTSCQKGWILGYYQKCHTSNMYSGPEGISDEG